MTEFADIVYPCLFTENGDMSSALPISEGIKTMNAFALNLATSMNLAPLALTPALD